MYAARTRRSHVLRDVTRALARSRDKFIFRFRCIFPSVDSVNDLSTI